MRRAWWVAGLATAACRYDFVDCPLGASPWDGRSEVPPDVVVELGTGRGPLPDDVPPIEPGVTFTDENGAPVPFHARYLPELGLVRIVPREPLREGHQYSVFGVNWFALRGGEHWWGEVPFAHDPTSTTFFVGSRPRAVAAWALADDTVVLVFSEPMDPATLAGRVRFVQDHVGAWDVEILGPWDGDPSLIQVLPTGDGVPVDGRRELVVSRGATARSGLPLEDDAHLGVDLDAEDDGRLIRYQGLPDCGDEG